MSSLLSEKLGRFVEGVYAREMKDGFEWIVEGDSYKARLGNYWIKVYYHNTPTETTDTVFELLGTDGIINMKVSDMDLFSVDTAIENQSGWFTIMSDVIDRAQMKANGLDKALNEVLGLLRQ